MTEKKKERTIKVPVKQRAASFAPALQYKILSDESINLTKDRAFKLLEMKAFHGERPVRDQHVQLLFDEWSAGRFMWERVIIETCELNAETYRINGQHTCFPPGTKVKMADGSHKTIEAIGIGDVVVSDIGIPRRVAQTRQQIHDGELCSIKLCGHAITQCTPDHRILTERGYIEAGRLTPDDWVCLPAYWPKGPGRLNTTPHISRARALGDGRKQQSRRSRALPNNRNEVPQSIGLDRNFGRLVGLYLAEGCSVDSQGTTRVQWAFGAHEESTLAAEVVSLAKDCLGLVCKAKLQPMNKTMVTGYGLLWAELFRSLCGVGAANKVIHPDLMSGPNEFLDGMLWGWLHGDGSKRGRNKENWCGATISEGLALQMFDIANILGYLPSIWKELGTKNPVWKVSIRQSEIRSQHRGLPKMGAGHLWRRVREIARAPFSGVVHDLGIEEDHSYIANGIGVHNCWMRVNIPPERDPAKVTVRHIHYRVESEEQMRALYSTIDRNAPRSVGHIGKVLLMGGRAAQDIPASYLNKLMAGFRIYFCEDWTTHFRNVAELIGMVEQSCPELFNTVGRFFQIHAIEWHPYIRRAAVLGAMFATFEKNPAQAQVFWEALASGLGFTGKTDARYTLKRFIESHSHSTQAGSNYLNQEELYRVCLLAWNHWRQGNEVSSLRTVDKRPKARL